MDPIGYNPKVIKDRDLLKQVDGRPVSFQGEIDRLTLNNTSFRVVLYTSIHMQLVLMSLEAGQEIDRELHEHVDQFFRVEGGSIDVYVENPDEILIGNEGDAVIVPAGTYHRVVAGENGAKLYTIYTPPNHPYNRVQNEKPMDD